MESEEVLAWWLVLVPERLAPSFRVHVDRGRPASRAARVKAFSHHSKLMSLFFSFPLRVFCEAKVSVNLRVASVPVGTCTSVGNTRTVQ
jgi:hypothetical protein